MRGHVLRITGSVPASHALQLPAASCQSLGLAGPYLYLQLRVTPPHIFIFHVDAACDDGIVVRISFSNLFKTFKATSTCLLVFAHCSTQPLQ